MLGVVGKLKIEYTRGGARFSDVVDLVDQKSFTLSGEPPARFTIDEITYIIDTVYGVEVSCGEDAWYVSGSDPTPFSLGALGVEGTMTLIFT